RGLLRYEFAFSTVRGNPHAEFTVEPGDFPERDELVVSTLRRALEVCVAAAPPRPAPPKPPTALELEATCAAAGNKAVCVEAERAAWDLEHMCTVYSDAISVTGRPGHTHPRLDKILASGADATPILLRLAQSANPAARGAAARGLGRLRS